MPRAITRTVNQIGMAAAIVRITIAPALFLMASLAGFLPRGHLQQSPIPATDRTPIIQSRATLICARSLGTAAASRRASSPFARHRQP